MKLTLQTQLLPEADQATKPKATVERFNEAADWLAGVAFERQVANKIVLRKLHWLLPTEDYGAASALGKRTPCKGRGPALRRASRTARQRGSSIRFQRLRPGFSALTTARIPSRSASGRRSQAARSSASRASDRSTSSRARCCSWRLASSAERSASATLASASGAGKSPGA